MTHSPGLDMAALRALRAPRHDVKPLLRRIEHHLDQHAGYLALSGGKDSTVVAHLARQVDPSCPMVFFDSGLEFPETYAYLAHLTEAWDLNLVVQPFPRNMLTVLVEDGGWDLTAPDGPSHLLDATDIAIPAAHAHARYGAGELWGVRAKESKGRSSLYNTQLTREVRDHCRGCCTTPAERRRAHGGIVRRQDGTCAFGPIWDWTDDDVLTYIDRVHAPINPVYAKLRALGAPPAAQRVTVIVDGLSTEEGRMTWLRAGWPSLFEDLATVLPRLRQLV